MTRILVTFQAEDAEAAEVIAALNQFPPYSLERAEMEAYLYMVLMRCAWRDIERLRLAERRLANQKKQKQEREQGQDQGT